MSIYTRSGDDGTTSLFGGKRVLKCEELVDVYGSVDELNSWVGLINAKCQMPNAKLFFSLKPFQSDLLTIGGTFAGGKLNLKPLESRIKEMERAIDVMDNQLPKLSNFILPGGSELGANIHIARSVCRRVERQTVALSKKQHVDLIIIKYLNRLSDLFFVLARFINKQAKVKETIWK